MQTRQQKEREKYKAAKRMVKQAAKDKAFKEHYKY